MQIKMKRLFLLTVVTAMSMLLPATPISRDVARQRAAAFLAGRLHVASARGDRKVAAEIREANCSSPYLYVYNVGMAEGFVVVSGDDRTAEILGYADSGTFDETLLPDNARAWLQGYSDEIRLLEGQQTSLPSPSASVPGFRSPIRPLLPTLWAQKEPYNELCPKGYPAGCVATAMAQVMKYYEWPKEETAAIPAYSSYEGLPPCVFEWDKMLSGYAGTEPAENREAVARLMKYCGQAVEMSYSSTSSAYERLIPVALRSYFGYDAAVRRVDRLDYTIAQWDSLIYSELAQGRPVIYSGQKSGSGHEFVCDGCDGNGLYHINWGWAGTSNGYFRLSVLTPATAGTGGGSSKGGYNITQSAVIGIQPAQGGIEPADESLLLTSEELFVTDATTVSRSSRNEKFSVKLRNAMGNHTATRLQQRYGIGLMRPDGTLAEKYQQGSTWFNPGAYTGRSASVTYSFGAKLTGTCRLVAICSPAEGTAQWQPAIGSDRHYIEAVLTESEVTLTEHPLRALTVDSLTWRQQGSGVEILAHLTNNGDEYNGTLCLRVNGSVRSTVGTAIAAGDTAIVTFYYSPSSGQQTWQVGYTPNDATWIYTTDTTYQATNVPESFCVWDKDGRASAVPVTGRQAVVPDYAVAADFRNIKPDSIAPNQNPNTLYYLADATKLSRVRGYGTRSLNVIQKNIAERITLTDGNDFFCPMAFTATAISYTRTFPSGYSPDGSGWSTLVLPYDVQSVNVGDGGQPSLALRPLNWFRAPDDSGKQFWLMELCESTSGSIVFTHSQSLQANRPYLIAVPGPAYGERSLTDCPIVFSSEHAVVQATDIVYDPRDAYNFVGTYATRSVPESYILNDTGSTFVHDDQPIFPFRAYLSSATVSDEDGARAIIGRSPSNHTDN